MWTWERCTISQPHFLTKCRMRRLNQDSFILLCFVLFAFSGMCLVFVASVFDLCSLLDAVKHWYWYKSAASCTQHYSFLTVFSRLWAKSTTFHREFSNPLTFPHSWDKRWQQRTHHRSHYDEQLFDNVRWNVSQILCSLLPPKFSALQDYSLRPRIHNLVTRLH